MSEGRVAFHVLVCVLLALLYWMGGRTGGGAHELVSSALSSSSSVRLIEGWTSRDVVSLAVERGDRKARFSYSDGSWRVVEPLEVSVHGGLLEALVTTLTDAAPPLEIAPAGADLEPFGLLGATTRLDLVAVDGRRVGLEIGRRNPRFTGVYARRAETSSPVFLIGMNSRYYLEILVDAIPASASREGVGLASADVGDKE